MVADGDLRGLAFDWITGNVYAVAEDGDILACDGNPGRNFSCATVLSGQGTLTGIALDPVQG